MSWITFDNLKRFWKNVRINPITFTGEVDLQNTTRYKGKEIATKADVEAGGSNITVDDALSDTSTNPVQNKVIKNALDKKLSTTGGTVTGDTIFRKKISAHEVCLAGLSDVSLVNKDNGSIAKDGLTILDEGNYNLFTPTLHGTGATGTWDINISGNALNDSDGNKIVDTYVKKSETPTAPNLTEYMKKSANSSLDMKEYPIYFGYARISLDDGFVIDGTGDRVKIKGTSLFFNNSRIDTREDNQKLYAPQISPTFTGTVVAPNVTVSNSLLIPGGKIWIA